jgi:hypothetical protein
MTRIHRNAAAGQWQEVDELRSNETLRLDAIPTFAIRLDSFG